MKTNNEIKTEVKKFMISIYGINKKIIEAWDAERAIIRASHLWTNGNTKGISALEVIDKNTETGNFIEAKY